MSTVKPLAIEFPLRGEWQTPTTPVQRIPSHGTNRLGLRYALDFIQVDWENRKKPFYQVSDLRYVFMGVPLEKCHCWGKEIHAPCDGEIIVAEDGYHERPVAHWLVDSCIAIKHALFFNEKKHDYRKIAGNYIMLKAKTGEYLLFAHLQTNSIEVSLSQQVKKGDVLARVGHSGNSTSPHLHFQVMDRRNIKNAKGIPCVFEKYEIYRNGNWQAVYQQLPNTTDRIRF